MKRLLCVLLSLIFMISCFVVDVSATGVTPDENDVSLTDVISSGEIWTVAGAATLCGTNWDPSDSDNQMVWNEEKQIYEKVYTGVPVGTHEFMVVKGTTWEEGIYNLQGNVRDGGGNASVKVTSGGSSVIVSFDGTKAYVSVSAPSKSGDFSFVVLPDGTAEITEYTGSDTTVTIPSTVDDYTVTSVGNNAFYGCVKLESVSVPDLVTSIGANAFYSCVNLKSVNIPNSVTNIEKYAFYTCESLSEITIPDNVTNIGERAFYRCISLENVVIPSGVQNLGAYAFEYCSGLNGVTFKSGVESIGAYAFYGCPNLTSVTIPNTVTKVNDYSFGYCDILSDVYYGGSWAQAQYMQIGSNNDFFKNANWHYEDAEVLGFTYDEENMTVSVENCAPFVESVEIPDTVEKDGKTYTVTKIESNAFSECTSLESVIIYTKSISLGENAFPKGAVVYGYYDISYIESEYGYDFKPLCELDNLDHSVITIKGYEATCAKEGLTDGVICEYCAFVYTPQEVIVSPPHKPIIVPAVAPSCKNEGSTLGSICEGCGEVYVASEVVPKLEHETVCDNNAVEPDCENTGLTDSFSCTLCGDVVVEQEVVDALGHSYVVLEGRPATDTQSGLTDGIGCSKCGYELIPQEIIPALVKLGDVNGDGNIAILDATIVQRHVAKITTLTDGALNAADVSKDGQIAIVDATMIQRFVAKIITEF